MEVVKAIKLDEAIVMLRNWISGHCSFSKQVYEYIFNKLLLLKTEMSFENDLILIIWFYENHLRTKAFIRPENKWNRQKASILIKLAQLVSEKKFDLRTTYYDVYEKGKWYIVT